MRQRLARTQLDHAAKCLRRARPVVLRVVNGAKCRVGFDAIGPDLNGLLEHGRSLRVSLELLVRLSKQI